MLYTLIRLIAFLLCKILFRIKVYGKENIPKKGAFLLVGNHVSYLDPVALAVTCPRKLNFVAKHDLFRNSFFGKFITAVGAFPIKRDTADVWALKETLRRLKEGKAVLVFPEGSRRFDAAIVEPYAGVGFIITKSDVPVIPSYIMGTESALPKGAKFIRLKKIKVYFGKKIQFERRKPDNYLDIAKEVMDNIRQISCQTNQ